MPASAARILDSANPGETGASQSAVSVAAKTRGNKGSVTKEHKFLGGNRGSLCVEEFRGDSTPPVREKRRADTRDQRTLNFAAQLLRSTCSMRFDVKTKRVLTETQQLSTAVLTSFSKFVGGLPIQGSLKYTGHLLGPNRLRVEN